MSAAEKSIIITPKEYGGVLGLFGRKQAQQTVIKGLDGTRYMFIVTSNGYRDRENEYVTTKALTDYVEKSWITNDKCYPNNTHDFYHAIEDGDIVWCNMNGNFLIEIAREKAGSFEYKGKSYPISAIWDYYEANPGVWGASHHFLTPAEEAEKGEYHHILKRKTTTLRAKHAANAYTYSGVIDMSTSERNNAAERMLQLSGLAAHLDKMDGEVKEVDEALKSVGEVAKSLKVLATASVDKAADAAPAPAKDAPATATEAEKPADEQEAAPQTPIEMLADTILQQMPELVNATPEEQLRILTETITAAVNSAKEAEQPAQTPAQTPAPAPAPQNAQPQTTMTDKANKYALLEPGEVNDPMEINKGLADLQSQLLGDLENVVKEQQDVRGEVEAVSKALANLPAQLQAFSDRLTAIEKQMNGAPRIASRAAETRIPDDKLPAEIKKGIDEQQYTEFLGLKVTK